MNFNVNKFKMPYTVPNKGRGLQTTFQYSPAWQQDIAPKMWNKVKNGAKFLLLWSPANSAKSHFALTFNEALPYTGYTVIVSHTTNIRNQHKKLIEHYYNTGYICKQVKSITIHQLYNWVKKLKNGYDITDKDKDILLSIDFLAIDELHKYSKGKSTKMLTTVADYLFQHGKLRLIVGTTMTGKYVNTIWQWAGTYVTRAKYTFWPDPKLLAKDGMSYPNNSEYLHCDKKTKVFDKQYTDSLGKRADDPFFDQYCSVLLNSDEDNAVDNLINEDHELKFRTDKKIRIECLAYLDCRVKCAIDHWIKFYLGQPAIINVPGVKNAEYYSKYFRKRLQSLGYDAIHWNGLSKNSHSTYKNDERSMLDDLCDLKKQLKITFTNGMLREGTNEEIEVVYQCAFTAGGAETSIQLGQRGKTTVIMLDAMNTSKIPQNTSLSKQLSEVFVDRTQEELDAIHCEQLRQNTKNPNHRLKATWEDFNKEYFDSFEPSTHTTEEGENYKVILSKDVWVKDVEYVGNHKTSNIFLHHNHQNLIDALDLAEEAVSVG